MKKTYTFTVEDGCRDMAWSVTAIRVTYAELLARIEALKAEHPEYVVCDIREGW